MVKLDSKEDFDLGKFLNHSLSLHGQMATQRSFPGSSKDPYLELYHQDPIDVLRERFSGPVGYNENATGTSIQEFYRSSSVFLTGGTGFVGKLLIEKLSRSIPQIDHIYLLIRPKREKSAPERFVELMNDRVFLRLKTERPNFQTKISYVVGDLSLPDLGLSLEDRQLIKENVHIIFNSAADVRFIEPLKSSVLSNVVGTRRVLELAKDVRNLKCFLQVSTAYSQCVRRCIPESVPKLPISYREVLTFIESKSDSELELEQGNRLGNAPVFKRG